MKKTILILLSLCGGNLFSALPHDRECREEMPERTREKIKALSMESQRKIFNEKYPGTVFSEIFYSSPDYKGIFKQTFGTYPKMPIWSAYKALFILNKQ